MKLLNVTVTLLATAVSVAYLLPAGLGERFGESFGVWLTLALVVGVPLGSLGEIRHRRRIGQHEVADAAIVWATGLAMTVALVIDFLSDSLCT